MSSIQYDQDLRRCEGHSAGGKYIRLLTFVSLIALVAGQIAVEYALITFLSTLSYQRVRLLQSSALSLVQSTLENMAMPGDEVHIAYALVYAAGPQPHWQARQAQVSQVAL